MAVPAHDTLPNDRAPLKGMLFVARARANRLAQLLRRCSAIASVKRREPPRRGVPPRTVPLGGLTRFLEDARIEIDSNFIKHSIGAIAFNRNANVDACESFAVDAAEDSGMARAYSQDLRDRVIDAASKDGTPARHAAARFGVGIATAIRWVRQARQSGDLKPGRQGQPRRSKLDQHRDYVRALAHTTDLTLTELAEKSGSSAASRSGGRRCGSSSAAPG